MEYWEFLIQREGDRGWRTIETGNLQLMTGKYRIIANSNLIDTQIQTRVTHQTAGSTEPQRRSQSRTQTTNSSGVLIIVPFTQIESGIWQFVCSGSIDGESWQQQLKLRVLPRTPAQPLVDLTQPSTVELLSPHPETAQIKTEHNHATAVIESKSPQQFLQPEQGDDIPAPTEPIIPISIVGEQESWADGLDRLLEQIEQESLRTSPQKISAGTIGIDPIVDFPAQLISLDRSTFSGIVPGHRLTISGACNLDRLKPNPIQSAKVTRLSICLRHPHTSAIIVAIEQSLPADLYTFAFRGQLELPTEPKITLLLGEVNLYDKHHIQIGTSGFTVTLNLNPLQESELSFLQLFNRPPTDPATNLDLLTQELQPAVTKVGIPTSAVTSTIPWQSLPLGKSVQSPPVHPDRVPLFTHPDIFPVNASTSQTSLTNDITGDLELDFALSSFVPPDPDRNYENLEVVVED